MPGSAPYQIIAGPADVYVAPVGTAFPAVNVTPSGAWVALGQTEGGVTVRHSQDLTFITTDQHTENVKAIRTAEGLQVEFSLAELTLENYIHVLNEVTVTSAAGPPATKTVKLFKGVDVAQKSLLVKGPSPYGNFYQQYQVPVVVADGEPEVQFVKDDKSVLACTWTALGDPNAATPADRFGSLVAQTA